VVFSGLSESFIVGTVLPDSSARAASLYTPVKDDSFPPVTRWVPTPHELIGAPLRTRDSMISSVSSLETVIVAFGKPARSRASRTFALRY
jgi:hypothetical protein